ncbi:hypothetical protein [Pelomonas sp. SE-A7]|uniref:hypothetical protein n=1 Tax=Pelomonas sp. SE-A7 TaxID=3054953 RepID=UPI00259CD04E|nr:hypothetical protein [Pelomonas sp. SE-A7]MDM4764837.1 hypothetical protein [Pelomonas sp. SE-A7]
MNLPTPAIVAERGAQRLPRLALLLLGAAYVLPGVFGRDPWRNADLTAFGFMASIAQGHAPWWQPAIGGIPADGGPLPFWLGALAIKVLPFLDPALAARLPFALVLLGVFVLVWYSSFHLARTEAAQPVAFAFGGEAQTTDYARAMADGALLALMASLGLLMLGHETTPELLQLLACSAYLYGLAAAPFRAVKSRVAVLLSLPMLAASGAPAVAMLFAGLGAWLCQRSSYDDVRGLTMWVLVAGLLGALSAWTFDAWAWRVHVPFGADYVLQQLSQFSWFCWPAWPLAFWTLWRWRQHWPRRHILLPLIVFTVPLVASVAMNGSDRALLLTLPPLAVLAAFALPTLKRSFAAAVDWFSVFFFSAVALFFWAYYLSMQQGWPPKLLANLQRLAQGFQPSFHPLALLIAALATLAWLALVRWRTARHQHALWKSLALPAGGVTLAWLLAMTLMLPPLDYARSNRALVERLKTQVPAGMNCLAVPGQAMSLIASLEFQGGWRVDGRLPLSHTKCNHALRYVQGQEASPAGWRLIALVKRPTDRGDQGYQLLAR